jgi:hypothetical protein
MNIEFPAYEPPIKKMDQKPQIWCLVRKKWVAFTKEEWVRQNWLNYLIHVQHYPASLMAVEKEIHLGELKKRIDILVYKNSSPWILIECKEQEVPLSEQTIQQILIYNIKLNVPYLVLSNGIESFGVFIKEGEIYNISTMPNITI